MSLGVLSRSWIARAQSGAGASLIGLYTSVFAQYVLYVVLARLLPRDQFGTVMVAFTASSIGSLVLQFGLHQSAVKFIGTYRATGDRRRLLGFILGGSALCIGGAACAAVFALGFVAAFPSRLGPYAGISEPAVAVTVVMALLLYFQNVARGFGRMYLATLPYGLILPLAAAAAAPAVVPSGGAAGFLWCYALIGLGLGIALLAVILTFRDLRGEHRPSFEFRRWIRVSLPMMGSAGLYQVLQRGDVLLLASLASPEVTGQYAIAARLTQVLALSNRAFNRYWAQAMAGHYAVSDRAALARVTRSCARSTLVATGTIWLVLVVAGKPLLELFGPGFSAAYPVLLLLGAGLMVQAFFAPGLVLLQMADRERMAVLVLLASVLVLAGLARLLIPAWGGLGAAFANAAGTAVLAATAAAVCWRSTRTWVGALGGPARVG